MKHRCPVESGDTSMKVHLKEAVDPRNHGLTERDSSRANPFLRPFMSPLPSHYRAQYCGLSVSHFLESIADYI